MGVTSIRWSTGARPTSLHAAFKLTGKLNKTMVKLKTGGRGRALQ